MVGDWQDFQQDAMLIYTIWHCEFLSIHYMGTDIYKAIEFANTIVDIPDEESCSYEKHCLVKNLYG